MLKSGSTSLVSGMSWKVGNGVGREEEARWWDVLAMGWVVAGEVLLDDAGVNIVGRGLEPVSITSA
jgi:hypothetical protein